MEFIIIFYTSSVLRIIFTLSLLVGSAGLVAAQSESKLTKFAEFGPMSQAGVKEKMQSFVLELSRSPSTQGYVINYGNRKALAARRKQLANSISFLKLDPSRIIFVDGPEEPKIRTVMWIFPEGETPPKP